MRGCSVFTRPSSISGKPVTSATSVTARPASASSRAVPPVDSSRTPERGQRAGEFDDAVSCRKRRGVQSAATWCGRSLAGPRGRLHFSSLWSSSLRRSVLRLMPSHSAALLWLPSAWRITTSSSGFSTAPRNNSCSPLGSAPRRSLKYCSRLARRQSSMSFFAHAAIVDRPSFGRRQAARARSASRSKKSVTASQLRAAVVDARSWRRGRPRRRAARAPPSRCACARCARRCIRRTARSGRAGARSASAARRAPPAAAAARRGQVVRDLAEDPRPALRGAADHQRVGAGARPAPRAPWRASRCRRWPPPAPRSAAFTAATVSYSAWPP